MLNLLLRSKDRCFIRGWNKRKYSGYIISYDFSWIEESIRAWPEEWITSENIECRLPSGIMYYFDYPGAEDNTPTTHLGEPIPDYNIYLEQKKEYVKKLIKKRVG